MSQRKAKARVMHVGGGEAEVRFGGRTVQLIVIVNAQTKRDAN